MLNQQLQVSPYTLTIKEFSDIWSRDTSELKDKAIKELSFIHFMCDFKSVYRGYDPNDRQTRLITDLRLGSWTPDDIVKAALTKYEELQQTPSMQLLKVMENSLHKIEKFFETYNVATDPNGAKFKAIIGSYKTIPDIVKGLGSLRELVETEQKQGITVRAGHSARRREMPPDKRK